MLLQVFRFRLPYLGFTLTFKVVLSFDLADEKITVQRSSDLFQVTRLGSCQNWDLNPGSLALKSAT